MNWQKAHEVIWGGFTNHDSDWGMSQDMEEALAFVKAMAERTADAPVTRYTHLPTGELQQAATLAAQQLKNAVQSHKQTLEDVKALTSDDTDLVALRDELATHEAKVKEAKSKIKQREAALIPLTIQEAMTEGELAVEAMRDELGDYLTEFYERFPKSEASDFALSVLESDTGDVSQLYVARSAEAGWEVTDLLAFALTLPKSHADLFKVSIIANTKKVSRAQINTWFDVEHAAGVLKGITRKPRTLVTVEGELFKVSPVDTASGKPEKLVKINW